jgi:hypothetical protein
MEWNALEIAVALTCLLIPAGPQSSFGVPDNPALSSQQRLRLGERIYREGILPSGKQLKTMTKGAPSVPGTAFSCESCHLRGGLGFFGENVLTPPVNGAKLFRPLKVYSSATRLGRPFSRSAQQNMRYFPVSPARPVYSDELLARALREGVDSGGRVMNDIMPRYLLENEDLKLLISYLKSLSVDYSPGVTDTMIHFATIITEGLSAEQENAMLVPLENFIRSKNQTSFMDPRAGSRSTGYRSRVMAETTTGSQEVAVRKLSLSRWTLKGPPETWRRQLEEYNRKEPVFAILGGMANGDWQPIHQFCEQNRIPSIFPITEFPVISHADWYTLYLSKGLYQEGEGAANFLNDRDDLPGKPIVQVVRETAESRALSRGFLETWRDFGHQAPVTLILKEGASLSAELLKQAIPGGKTAIIVLWDGPDALKVLENLPLGGYRPAMVLASSTLLGKSLLSSSEKVRDFVFQTYPYGISKTLEEKRNSLSRMGAKNFNFEANTVGTTRILQQTYILTTIMNMALIDLRGNYYRDNLLDVIGALMDQNLPLYENLVFGPGQRYASNGCYVVQCGRTGLVKKSGWMIH